MARYYKLLLALWTAWGAARTSQRHGIVRLADIALAATPIFLPVVGGGIFTVDIVRNNLHPLEKLIWIGTVWTFPGVGPLLYLLIGERHRGPLARRA